MNGNLRSVVIRRMARLLDGISVDMEKKRVYSAMCKRDKYEHLQANYKIATGEVWEYSGVLSKRPQA